ncbi:hypothetical protein [Peribacillus simplex]|uniref:hypothetical protein n=1 Tax=Peribacillus simplex TaxID=1478 RepID=UPI001C86DF2C|nr:hypothetical protein [Peribacillus simplex]
MLIQLDSNSFITVQKKGHILEVVKGIMENNKEDLHELSFMLESSCYRSPSYGVSYGKSQLDCNFQWEWE